METQSFETAQLFLSWALRALQEREVRRIGADKVIAVDVRVISATNSDLRDLLYRLDVLTLSVPPLRARPDDIVPLFSFFLKRCCMLHSIPVPQMTPRTLEPLRTYEFTGNVRELRNIAARASVLHHDPQRLTGEDVERALYPDAAPFASLSQGRVGEGGATAEVAGQALVLMEEEVRRQTLQALADAGGRRGKAAEILEIDRTTLWRRLRKYR